MPSISSSIAQTVDFLAIVHPNRKANGVSTAIIILDLDLTVKVNQEIEVCPALSTKTGMTQRMH